MKFLDMRTILVSFTICTVLCTVVIFYLWKQNRRHYSGLGYWLINYVLTVFGMALLASRGTIPDFFSVFIGNLVLIIGFLILYVGFEKFLGKATTHTLNLIILGGFIILQLFFLYVRPSLLARNIVVTGTLITISLKLIWLLRYKVDSELRKSVSSLVYVAASVCIIGIIRIIGNILFPPGNNLLEESTFDEWIYLAFQTIYIALTFYLFLLINHRLFVELDRDVQKRREIERALSLSEEKYSKAFKNSPDAILITTIKEGRIVDVNESFCKITGYSRDEAIGHTTLEMNIWVEPEERKKVVADMLTQSRVVDFDFDLRIKSGKILKGQFSGETIKIADENCMLSVIRDISEMELAKKLMQLRATFWEYASTHTTVELMQHALDEIEILTDSQIGFYHFVEEDQKKLSLQAWSTRTKRDFCRAEGEGMHYSVDKAGVWVDAIHQKKPVIHNNYATLSHRKGLPEGHAEVIRELVVPTIQDGKIVSIMGVGNKLKEYDEDDVNLVQYFSNIVWKIIIEKRANETIKKLNEKLETLAMTDELTRLNNRRSFFLRGIQEIERCKRYPMFLSLIMLDIDHFKKINDTYGHDFGDMALKCVAEILSRFIREVDMAARLGGEEFCVLLPNTRGSDAMILAERLRIAIQENNCGTDEQKINLTASFGVSEYMKETKSIDEILHQADAAMYEAKKQGRNRVLAYQGNRNDSDINN